MIIIAPTEDTLTVVYATVTMDTQETAVKSNTGRVRKC